MVVAQTGGQIEARHLLGYLHLRRPASIRPCYYFLKPRYGVQMFKVYEVDGTVN